MQQWQSFRDRFEAEARAAEEQRLAEAAEVLRVQQEQEAHEAARVEEQRRRREEEQKSVSYAVAATHSLLQSSSTFAIRQVDILSDSLRGLIHDYKDVHFLPYAD